MQRFGDTPRADQRYIRRPGVYAILPRGRGLLLTHQSAPEPEVQLPGGGVDPGEHPLTALHREVFEETGWKIAAPQRLGVFKRFTYMPEYDLWAEKICTIYRAIPVCELSAPTEPDHTVLWLPPEQAIEMLGNRGDRHFVGKYLKLF